MSLKLLNDANSLQVEIASGEGQFSARRGEGLVTTQGLRLAEIDLAIAQLAVPPRFEVLLDGDPIAQAFVDAAVFFAFPQ